MLNSRRAFVAAATLLALFFLVSRSHESPSMVKSQRAHAPAKPGSVAAVAGHAAKAWSGGRAAPQKPMMDMSRLSTHDKLAYAFPYDMETKFPAYIWQTWKTTPADESFQFREQETSWTEQHPGFIHEVVSDDVAKSLLGLLYASVPEVLDAYHALPLPVLKADFFRYLILLARGGIYSDIDTYAIKSALDWIPAEIPRETIGLVVGIEADPDRPDWAQWYSRRIQFCQWTIQSKPGHPVLRDIVSRITNHTMAMKRSGELASIGGKNVIEFTGPAVWTDTIMDYFNNDRYFDMNDSKALIDWHNFTGIDASTRIGDVVVLPITSFSPGVEQMGSKDYEDPMAFVKHDFEGTWKPESERHIGQEKAEATKSAS
ncbi:hypothetical protein G6O67_005299 [Ophiocordyceps sinensis]|uniref:Initiation-specific alpha-1,6-mannosyltransferase n=2 Tax=Ophiocordyceps sinensis TaxID=72228 RepID=A0A8H4V5S1_9HYPO|nr:initiation-specific alpha-1,6-mannosyltransferase [Ophiocordyceps sinensis CO18]KAF4508983.1 hypothetical protein G6O67_005299 [Ophiocordyceps sinensis]